MTNNINIEVDNLKISKEEAIKRGLWKTGHNKFVDINTITDIDYLQAILRTLNQRESKYYKEIEDALNKLYTIGDIYLTIFNRIVELSKEHEVNIKLRHHPFSEKASDNLFKHEMQEDHLHDPSLKGYYLEISKIIDILCS